MAAKSDFLTAVTATTKIGTTLAFTVNLGDYATVTSHGLVDFTGPVTVAPDGVDDVLPAGLAEDTNYWVLAVDSNKLQFCASAADAVAGVIIDLTDVGDGTIDIAKDVLALDFVSGDVDATANTITETAHGLITGYGPITFTLQGDASVLPGNLAALTNYWVIRTSADAFKVASSLALALAGTAIDITNTGTGGTGGFRAQNAAIAKSFADTDVDITQTITATAHGKSTGFGPVRLSTSNTLPTPLGITTDYWLVSVSADSIAFATSEANANNGIVIPLTDVGTGTFAMSCTMQTLADALENVLNVDTTFPGNKDRRAADTIRKFWDEALLAADI